MSTDDQLIEMAAAGDGEAFARLIAQHRVPLVRFAGSILGGDRQAGEEVVQEAMLNAYRALEQGARPDLVRPWLFAIVRNGAINVRRRAQPTCELDDTHGSSAHTTPNEAAEQGEWIEWLMGAIAELPARQRQALVGRELEGRSHAELAAALGTSALAVKTLLHRARGRLRRLREEAMFSAGLLLRGRAAGAKAGAGTKAAAGSVGSALAAASVTSLIVLAVHGGGVGSVRAAGLPPRSVTISAAGRRQAPPAPGGEAPPPRSQVTHEARQAIARCIHGRPLGSLSPAGLERAIHRLSTDQLEYTDCEGQFRTAIASAG